MIRLAKKTDIPAIVAIYDRIHDAEEAGRCTIGWDRAIYPTEATARDALNRNDLFVLEAGGKIVAAGRINREQVPEYALAPWKWEAEPAQIMVLHTLVVDPGCGRKGYGSEFVGFYESYAKAQGCLCLRMDTNARNLTARAMYKKLGYREAGAVPCTFNGIPGVSLVCLEKRL